MHTRMPLCNIMNTFKANTRWYVFERALHFYSKTFPTSRWPGCRSGKTHCLCFHFGLFPIFQQRVTDAFTTQDAFRLFRNLAFSILVHKWVSFCVASFLFVARLLPLHRHSSIFSFHPGYWSVVLSWNFSC